MQSKCNRADEFARKAHEERGFGINYGPSTKRISTTLSDYGVVDEDILCATILRYVTDNTNTHFIAVEDEFGEKIADIVRELACGTSNLDEQKIIRLHRAKSLSDSAKLIELATVYDILKKFEPEIPFGWSIEHAKQFLDWQYRLAEQLFGVSDKLDALVTATIRRQKDGGLRLCGVNIPFPDDDNDDF